MGLIDVAAKCRTLCLIRYRSQGEKIGSLTAAWLDVWTSSSPMAKPPSPRVYHGNLSDLRLNFKE
jgi:hypothetical protein